MLADAQNVATALSLTVAMALLLVIWRALAGYRDDNLRDQLFAIRDEMFLYALDHGIAETAGHEHLRLLMNRLIRYAHRVSLVRAVLLDLGRRAFKITPSASPLCREWVEAVDALPADQAQAMRDFHEKATAAIVIHMINGSPVLWSASDLILFHVIVFESLRVFTRRVVNSLKNLLEADALQRT